MQLDEVPELERAPPSSRCDLRTQGCLRFHTKADVGGEAAVP